MLQGAFERWAVTSVVVALLLAAAPGADARSWRPPQEVGLGSGVSVAADRAGNAIVAYNDRTSVKVRTRSAAGALGPVQTLDNALPGNLLRAVEVVMDPDGNAVVAWLVKTPPNRPWWLVVATRRPGEPFGRSRVLATDVTRVDNVSNYHLAIGPGGWAAALWRHYTPPHGSTDGEPEFVEAAIRPPGGTFGPTEQVSPNGSYVDFPRIAINAAGGALAAWADSSNGVEMAARPPGGIWSLPGQLTPDSFAGRADISFDEQGNALTTFLREVQWGDWRLTARYATAGGGFGAVEQVSQPVDRIADTAGLSGPALVGFDSSGAGTVLWRDRSSRQLLVSSRPPGGPFDTSVPVSKDPAEDASLAVSPNGNTLVAWFPFTGVQSEDIPRPLYSNARAAGGSFGGVQQLADAALDADVAADGRGGGVAAWSASYGLGCSLVVVSGYSDAAPVSTDPISPPACSGPPPPTPAPIFGDHAPPVLEVAGDPYQHPVDRRVSISLQCSEECRAVVKATFVQRSARLPLKPVTRTIQKGKRVRIALRLPKRVLRRLGTRPQKLLVDVSVADRANNRTTRRRTLFLTR
jgi:hypothetical protein